MPGSNSRRRSSSPRAAFFITALVVVTLDQLSKLWVRAEIAPGESIPDSGFFCLSHVQNSGAAFGLFQDQTLILTLASLVGIAIILYIFSISGKLPPLDNIRGKIALGLVFGGTVGNLIDRLSLGYVTDFIDIGLWPIFNIADSAVNIGIISLGYLFLRHMKREKSSNGQGIQANRRQAGNSP